MTERNLPSFARVIGLAVLVGWVCGCRTTIPIAPVQITQLAEYAQRGSTVVVDRGHEVLVVPDHAPELALELKVPAGSWQGLLGNRRERASGELSDLRVTGTHLSFGGEIENARSILLSDVEEAELSLYGYAPPWRRPRWGVGFSILGPGGLLAVTGQWAPFDWAVVEIGTVPAPEVLAWFIATRFRGPRLAFARPFVGAFAAVAIAIDPQSGNSQTLTPVGGRVGMELAAPGDHLVLVGELDVAHPLNRDRQFYLDRTGSWIPWGGATIWYMF